MAHCLSMMDRYKQAPDGARDGGIALAPDDQQRASAMLKEAFTACNILF